MRATLLAPTGVLLVTLAACSSTVGAATGADARPPVAAPKLESDVSPSREREQPIALSRGQMLYENHCQGCHESTVHIRDPRKRKVRSLDELRAQIVRWAVELRLDWREEDVSDVARYLNGRYYRLAPPLRRN